MRSAYQNDVCGQRSAELVDVSRIQSGKLQLTMARFSLDELIFGTVENFAGTERKRTSAEVSVKDLGRGISQSHLKRIFERFYQVPGSSGGQAGMGLGLYIANRIIKMHRGKIWVESRPGKVPLSISLYLPLVLTVNNIQSR